MLDRTFRRLLLSAVLLFPTAPRGPREVCPNGHYMPAFKNSPSATRFPCAGNEGCAGGACSSGGTCPTCAAGALGTPVAAESGPILGEPQPLSSRPAVLPANFAGTSGTEAPK